MAFDVIPLPGRILSDPNSIVSFNVWVSRDVKVTADLHREFNRPYCCNSFDVTVRQKGLFLRLHLCCPDKCVLEQFLKDVSLKIFHSTQRDVT